MEKLRHTRVQLLLQYDYASTSQIDSWKPPATSTPIHSHHYQIRKSACSFLKPDQKDLHTNHIKPSTDLPNLNLKCNNSSRSNPSDQLLKTRNQSIRAMGFCSDSSSDDEDDPGVASKKLIIKLSADKSNKVVDKNEVVSCDKNAFKKKRGLKVNNVNSTKTKISSDKQVEVKKNLRMKKQIDVKDLSSFDKENVVEDIDQKMSRSPIRKKTSKVRSAASEKSQKRKGVNDSISKRNVKKLKVAELEKDESLNQIEEPVATSPDVLRTEEKMEVLEKTRNSSQHQLFSETKEQEFLESLDLTAVEMEEPVKLESRSPKKKKITKKLSQAKKKEKNDCSVLSDRPARSRKPPKKFWLPESEIEKPSSNMVGTSSSEGEQNQVKTCKASKLTHRDDEEKTVSSSSSNKKRNINEECVPSKFSVCIFLKTKSSFIIL